MNAGSKINIYHVSIAVLPFLNMSSDKENEYFSDGISEEIINTLATIKGFDVTARTSSFSFKGQGIDVREIGKRLNVEYILEGSVRKADNQVRICAQLVKAKDGFHIFSEEYDRELKDIFKIQDEISTLIIDKLKVSVGNTVKTSTVESEEDLFAYEQHLKCKYLFAQATEEAVREAIGTYNDIIEKKPDYAKAYAGLSMCYTFLKIRDLMDTKEADLLAIKHAETAIELDDNLADGHLSYIYHSFWIDWNPHNAYKSVLKVLQSNPGNADVHSVYSVFLLLIGKNDEAHAEAKLSLKLDPLSPRILQRAGIIYYCLEMYDEAIEIFREEQKINPYNISTVLLMGYCYILKNEPDNAISYFKNIEYGPSLKYTDYSGMSMVHLKKGEIDKVYECYHTLNDLDSQGKILYSEYFYAIMYLSMNKKDKALESLDSCVENKNSIALFISKDPIWKELHDEKKFWKICDKIFPENFDEINSIVIQGDTQDTVKINPDTLIFIEAEDNYSNFVWISNGEIKEKLIRVTLKHVEDQIDSNQYIRCHRSFIINKSAEFKVIGNSNSQKLKSPYLEKLVPVSRTCRKDLISKLESGQED